MLEDYMVLGGYKHDTICSLDKEIMQKSLITGHDL